eukprot:TRINITY_DN24908_c0_g1_i1.p1 TRINITY_DN24908_c0_g1~~TRINITY_DN24908_c0_g1_i1.p1  ORF type:complete len:444 (+),score=119.51 TRINITY_DN24908_c0_g1_i1:58-1389(+)
MTAGLRIDGADFKAVDITIDSCFEDVPVAAAVGIPLRIKRLKRTASGPLAVAVRLMSDPESGFAPPSWQTDCPVVEVARADGVAFTKVQWMVLDDFITQVVHAECEEVGYCKSATRGRFAAFLDARGIERFPAGGAEPAPSFVGERVRIHGLTSTTGRSLNGRHAHCVGDDGDGGRLHLRVGSDMFKIKRENVTLEETGPDSAVDEPCVPATSAEAGSLVRIGGESSQPSLNGCTAQVVSLKDNGRVEVRQAHAARSYTLDAACVAALPADAARRHEHAEFWPLAQSGGVAVSPVSGEWPSDWSQEKAFLKRQGWKAPEILGGVTQKGYRKPDFMMYYDAKDTASPVNPFAEAIAALLPGYERGKVPAPKGGKYRGSCILVFSPMNTSNTKHDTRFTLDELREVVQFHTTDGAKAMYTAHDNPMHRVFGGNMSSVFSSFFGGQ